MYLTSLFFLGEVVAVAMAPAPVVSVHELAPGKPAAASGATAAPCRCAQPRRTDRHGTLIEDEAAAAAAPTPTPPDTVAVGAVGNTSGVVYDVVGDFAHMRWMGADWYLVRRASGVQGQWHRVRLRPRPRPRAL
jgi:hypothetical protein